MERLKPHKSEYPDAPERPKMTLQDASSTNAPMTEPTHDELKEQKLDLIYMLEHITGLIESAGVRNLSNGVQLGATSWFVKMNRTIANAKHLMSEMEQTK